MSLSKPLYIVPVSTTIIGRISTFDNLHIFSVCSNLVKTFPTDVVFVRDGCNIDDVSRVLGLVDNDDVRLVVLHRIDLNSKDLSVFVFFDYPGLVGILFEAELV